MQARYNKGGYFMPHLPEFGEIFFHTNLLSTKTHTINIWLVLNRLYSSENLSPHFLALKLLNQLTHCHELRCIIMIYWISYSELFHQDGISKHCLQTTMAGVKIPNKPYISLHLYAANVIHGIIDECSKYLSLCLEREGIMAYPTGLVSKYGA